MNRGAPQYCGRRQQLHQSQTLPWPCSDLAFMGVFSPVVLFLWFRKQQRMMMFTKTKLWHTFFFFLNKTSHELTITFWLDRLKTSAMTRFWAGSHCVSTTMGFCCCRWAEFGHYNFVIAPPLDINYTRTPETCKKRGSNCITLRKQNLICTVFPVVCHF